MCLFIFIDIDNKKRRRILLLRYVMPIYVNN
jgi:hypothetical protein